MRSAAGTQVLPATQKNVEIFIVWFIVNGNSTDLVNLVYDQRVLTLKLWPDVRQFFLFYQQCLCVTQKLSCLTPAVFVLQFHSCLLLNYETKQRLWLQLEISFQTTHASLEEEGIFLLLFTFGIDVWILETYFPFWTINLVKVLQDLSSVGKFHWILQITGYSPLLLFVYKTLMKQMFYTTLPCVYLMLQSKSTIFKDVIVITVMHHMQWLKITAALCIWYHEE